jgi:predicted RNase H-like nuclease
MVVVGIDACKSGWIAVVLSENTRRALYLREIGELAQAVAADDQSTHRG